MCRSRGGAFSDWPLLPPPGTERLPLGFAGLLNIATEDLAFAVLVSLNIVSPTLLKVVTRFLLSVRPWERSVRTFCLF